VTEVDEHVLVARQEGKVLLQQETGRRRKGLWKLPGRSGEEVAGLTPSGKHKYGITRYRVTMHLYETDGAQAAEGERWFRLEEVADLPMPSPYRRAVERYLGG
jgi:A/G-specific adenine glycosylase